MKAITEIFNKYASQYTTIENTMNMQQFTQAVKELLEKQRRLIFKKLTINVNPDDSSEFDAYLKSATLVLNTKLEEQQ